MDMWNNKAMEKFVTNVGLITSDGTHGHNVMAAEWTHMLSYKPGMICVAIGHDKATANNIRATKEFGVSLTSVAQTSAASVAGNYSGKEHNKINALKELGVRFYGGKKIKALMVSGAAANMECRLVKEIVLGDHTLFVGKILNASAGGAEPVAYHSGKYWALTRGIKKPTETARKTMRGIVEKHKKRLNSDARE